ncbi:unnamed protein product [Arctogadus glacialis]
MLCIATEAPPGGRNVRTMFLEMSSKQRLNSHESTHVKPRAFDQRISNESNLEVSTRATYNATRHTFFTLFSTIVCIT